MSRLVALAALLVAVSACEKKENPAPATAAPATPAAPATSVTPAATTAAKGADDGILEEDFEDEAEQKISAQNANDELDKLEKEISSE